MIKNLLFLLVFFTISSYSQTHFESGYFITNNDQKIICDIRNLDWRSNPTTFDYMLQDGAVVQQGTIANVKEFGIDNIVKYVRHTVEIDRSSENLAIMSTEKNPILVQESLFLTVLIEGGANLYEYRGDGNLKRFFYSKGANDVKQLIFKSYRNTPTTFAENNYFRQQLWNEFKCADITLQKIETIDYDRGDLVSFFTSYNKCSNNDFVVFEKKNAGGNFNLSLRAHINSTSASIFNSATDIRDVDFGNAVVVAFGLEAEYILGFNNNKWGIILEPTYQKFKQSKSNSSTTVSGGVLTASIDYSSLEIPLGIRHYFFLNDSSKLFLNASFIYDVAFEPSIMFTRSDGSFISGLAIMTRTNLGVGAGYKFKDRYSVELRYKTNRQLLGDYTYWDSKYNVASLIIGYSIF